MARADDHDDPNSEGTARALQMAAMAASVTEALARLSAQRAAEREDGPAHRCSSPRAAAGPPRRRPGGLDTSR
jgi:hypothetical protein